MELRAVVSVVGRFPAVAGADLDVAPGEVVLLTGPNGAGKTSILRVCAGLAPVTGGRAVVLGRDISDRREVRWVRRAVGYLGHDNGLHPELSVADNVRFWARAGGADPAAAEEAMDLLGVSGRLAGVPVGRCSAGQRRRAALAVLVARRPALWLLDEPHAGLDAPGRELCDRLITGAAAAGAAVLVASHDTDRLAPLAHRTATVVGGRVRSPAPDRAPAPVGSGVTEGDPGA